MLPPEKATFGPPGEHPLDSDWWRQWSGDAPSPPSPPIAPAVAATGAPMAPPRAARKTGRKRGRRRAYLFCEQPAGGLVYLPAQWGHATLNLEAGFGVGGFLQEGGGGAGAGGAGGAAESLGLHMQVVHAPRGLGSLQNAALLHAEWYRRVARAFPADPLSL